MAIVKHIKSRNANYSAAINYLLFEHDEKTGKKIVDESGRSILRKEFYMDGLNCDPMSFDKECELTNAHFHKNKKREDIKSHHYIISYDPADVTENGLTGEKAQAISLELAKQMFPGYQALVVTHTDGHNESGNIHTHIVISSVRKDAVERQSYMDKPHEEAAGYKHRSTDKFMNAFKKTVMERCQQEGLHQIDLLALAERKITQKEYMTQKHGQQKLYEINQKIIQDGLKPTSTVFLTQKEYLRNAIDECAAIFNSFDEFQSKLLEQFHISVIEHRGRYSYLHPDRQKRITERALGTRYGKEHLEQTFLRKDPLAILYVRSHLRLVVNLQTNVKAMQSPAYAHRIKLSNLQQMANTIIYVQEHGFDTQEEVTTSLYSEPLYTTKPLGKTILPIAFNVLYFKNKSVPIGFPCILASSKPGPFLIVSGTSSKISTPDVNRRFVSQSTSLSNKPYIMYLVIAEKPSVSRAIAEVIGAQEREDGYLQGTDCMVSWCFGHLAEYVSPDAYDEKFNQWRYEDLPIIPKDWKVTVSEDKKDQFYKR